MNVIRWLTRIEYSLCAIGFVLLLAALAADLAAPDGNFFGYSSGYNFGASQALATLGVILIGLFGMGPALVETASSTWFGPFSWLRPVAHACTALLFFILFCLAAFVASETRVLGGHSGLGWPLWIVQSLMVLAFGGNVVRFSIYAADRSAQVRAD